jgi:hypothetical protein
MSEAFDPYHRWLGISPKHRPPNHYRLLGLEQGESDPEVIRDAAERQMGHVRQYQLGPHAELSQRILNELATAKGCLLDARRKAAYDADLGLGSVDHRQPPAARTKYPLSDELPPPPTAPPQLPVMFEPVKASPFERPSAKLLWALAAATVVLGVVVTFAVVVVFREPAPPEVAEPVPPSPAPVTQVEPSPEPVKPVEPVPVEKNPLPPNPWPLVGEQVARALVRLEMITADGHPHQGLGLVTDPKGVLLSSAEPLEGFQAATAFFANGTFQSLQPPIAIDRRLGLAAFRIQPVPIEPVPICRMVPVPGLPLAMVRVLASPPPETRTLALKRTVPRTEALARLGRPAESPTAAQFGLDPAVWLDLTGPITPEDRGGAVFNVHAQLVGLVVWSDPLRQTHFAVPAGEIDGFLGRVSDAMAARPASPTVVRPAVEGPLLPSGRVFSDAYYSLANTPTLLTQTAAKNPLEVVDVGAVGGFLRGFIRPGLFGSAAVFFDRNATQPALSLEYRNEQRSGLVQMWNQEGQRVYCCQYVNAQREGFCCLLENNQPRLVLEYHSQQCLGVLLLAGGKTEKSFADLAVARTDPAASPKLAELDKIEEEIDRIDRQLLRKFKQELDDREDKERRKKAAAYTRHARERINQRIDQHRRENAASINALQRKAMGK